MTTRVIEYIFGHMTEKVQRSNLRFMEIAQKLSNDVFCYLLTFVNSNELGVSIRTEQQDIFV